ncbi:MAG TPA: FG-GAP repeat protein [Oculatellaceae cyanobacterium]
MRRNLEFLVVFLFCIHSYSHAGWVEAEKIVAGDRAVDDRFGNSVSISGDYAIVGAYGEDEDVAGLNTLTYAGSADDKPFFRLSVIPM